LKPINRSRHKGSSEFFRPNHGHEQVDEKQQGNDPDDEIPHNIGSYNFSQNRTYNAATTKKPAMTPMKIKSLINLERTSRWSTVATSHCLFLSGS
jgi:hypothetical protein